jgi:transposase
MPKGRPKPILTLSEEEREQLQGWTRSPSLPQGLATRSRIVLLAAQGSSNRAVAVRLNVSPATVGKWRRRFLGEGIPGLYDEVRPGRPRSIEDERIAELLSKTTQTRPRDGTHWTCRAVAGETGISKSTVQRIRHAFGLKPHRVKSFKLSTDPFFVEKVRDVVGLFTLGSAPLFEPGFRSVVLGQLGESRLLAAIDSDIAGDQSHARRMRPISTVRTTRSSKQWKRSRRRPGVGALG